VLIYSMVIDHSRFSGYVITADSVVGLGDYSGAHNVYLETGFVKIIDIALKDYNH